MITHKLFIGVKDITMKDNVIRNLDSSISYEIVLGDKVKCFSELVNNCIKLCKTEIFIFCSHRVSPNTDDVIRMINLINSGYGFVGLYRFAFFAIHIDVIKKVGLFDENFISGGYEDDDYRIRMHYKNIAIYEDHSVEYRPGPSTFQVLTCYQWFLKKYTFDHKNKTIKKHIEDKCIDNINTEKFMTYDQSIFVKNSSYYGSYNLQTYKLL
jgi:hypothetical protein